MKERELVALPLLPSGCHVGVINLYLFITVPWVGLWCDCGISWSFSKTCLKGPLERRPPKYIFNSDNRLLQVKRIAECSSGLFCHTFGLHLSSKKEGKYQELIQSSTTPDPGYQWESDSITNESQEVSPCPAGHHKASKNRRA